MWIIPVVKGTYQRLLMDDNHRGDLTINFLKIAAYATYLHIFATLVDPSENITMKVYNTAAEVLGK